MKRVLIVADDPFERDYLTEVFQTWGYAVDAVGNRQEAAKRGLSRAYRLYLIADALPDGSGIDLCRHLRTINKETPIVVFSRDEGNVTLAIEAGANAFVRTGGGLASLLSQALSLIADASVTKKPPRDP